MSQQNNLDNELDNFDIFNPSPENNGSEEIENEPSEVASQDGSELTNKDRVTAFFLQPEVKSQVDLISRSSLATYKKVKSNYHRVINILNVSRGKKVKDLQGGSKDCEILCTYRDWMKSDTLMENIPGELKIALEKYKSHEKPQRSITDFFKKTEIPIKIGDSDKENNNSSRPSSTQYPKARGVFNSNATSSPVKRSSILQILGLSEEEERNIETQLKIDKDLFNCKSVTGKIQDFKANEEELSGKLAWEQKKCKFAAKKKFVKTELAAIRDAFKEVALLCNKEKNLADAEHLSFEDIGRIMTERAAEAKSKAKSGFLRILSKDLTESLRYLNHYMRRRVSNIDKSFNPNPEIIFTCSNGSSTWETCLKQLEDIGWKPTTKNGNIRLDQFYSCAELFRAMEFRGDEFIESSNLLGWIKALEEKPMTVLNTLVERLPILMVRKGRKIALINVTTFLRSQTLVEDLMNIDAPQESNIDGVEVTEGEIIIQPRKPRSVRIVEKHPEVLEEARAFAEIAGTAAHDRRRSEVGRVGFTIDEITQFIKNTCFQETPDLAPSKSTVRRIFEAPNKCRNSTGLYKADISARPGVKRNDDISGEVHPHRHECFASFKIAREFFALHEAETNTMSCDDKCKIPIGIPVVHRLNSINHKFFLSDSGPNFPDHDTLRSGSLINPQGYMLLKSSSSGASEQIGNSGSEASELLTEDNYLSHKSPGPSNQDDLDQEIVPSFVPRGLNLVDEFAQLDGANETSSGSEDEFGMDAMDLFRSAGPSRKRSRIESDDEYNPNIEESEDETEVIPTEQEEQEDDGEQLTMSDFPGAKFVLIDGRYHVLTPHTGDVFIFYKSHQAKPSSISRHVNDLLTIAEDQPCLKEKPNLLLLLDDGLDWGGRGLQTLFYLGELWRLLDLDLLVISRNAPGDSKHNPIEHVWGFINKKLSGLVLPPRRPDQTLEESEDEAIDYLIECCLKDLKFDGHPINNVHVPCQSSIVTIGEKNYENDHISQDETLIVQKIMEDKKMDKRKMREEYPEIYERLQIIFRHMDVRLHGYVFRKCHPKEYQCDFCKKNPRRSSDKFWESLPRKSSGGLFFDLQPDPEKPDHYRTLLDMMKDVVKIKIQPDGMFKDVFGRCKEKGCMVSFKCNADADRHFRLAHRNDNIQKNPYGHVCTFKTNDGVCGKSFEKSLLLRKHKIQSNHINRRKRGGGS